MGALVGTRANIKLVKFGSQDKGKYLATACNEVVNIINIRTGAVEH